MSKRRTSIGITFSNFFGLRSPMVESNEDIVPIKTGHLSVKVDTIFKGTYCEKRQQSGSLDKETNWIVVLKIYTREEDDFSGTLTYTSADYENSPSFKTEINGKFETFSQGEVEEVNVIEGNSDCLRTFIIEADSSILELDVIGANLKDNSIVLTGRMTLNKVIL